MPPITNGEEALGTRQEPSTQPVRADWMPETRRLIFPGQRDWWLLVGALLFLFTFQLGTRGLNEPDEGRYAAIARAITAPGGDWWEPRMSGWGHYDKPPLIYWVTAASFRLFGINEWAARLPSLAGAILSLAGLGWAAARLRGARVAWWAVLICGTSAQFWLLGRVLSPDMLLCGWCTVAIAAWAECRHRDGAWRFWALAVFCWTLAWWTKATPTLVPLAGLAAGVWITRDAAGRGALRFFLLLPLVLVLGAPWYLSMMTRYPELQSFFFTRELACRMAGNVNGRHGSLFYYLPVTVGIWLPWWPVAAWCLWRERPNWPGQLRGWCSQIGVEGWIVVTGLAIFSLVSSKLATYTLPLMPWAALLMARVVCCRVETGESWFASRFFIPAVAFATVACFGVWLFPSYETSLGPNSSLRRVCGFLETHKARRVDLDHYWPGMEVYLPHAALFYVVRDDAANLRKDAAKSSGKPRDERYRERLSDPGLPPIRFSEMTPWPDLPVSDPRRAELETGELWFVRFDRQKDSPFNEFIRRAPDEGPPELMLRDGDFRVYRTVLDHSALPPKHPAVTVQAP